MGNDPLVPGTRGGKSAKTAAARGENVAEWSDGVKNANKKL